MKKKINDILAIKPTSSSKSFIQQGWNYKLLSIFTDNDTDKYREDLFGCVLEIKTMINKIGKSNEAGIDSIVEDSLNIMTYLIIPFVTVWCNMFTKFVDASDRMCDIVINSGNSI